MFFGILLAMTERNDQEQLRFDRRAELLQQGVEVYPARTQRSTTVAHLLQRWQEGSEQTIVGRVRAVRLQGGSGFMRLEDETGQIQIFAQKKQLGEAFAAVTKKIDLGDFLQVRGTTFVTQRGEKTIDAVEITWLAKALRPLPSEWHGLADVETRYRFRELDTLTNEDSKKVFITRSRILQYIREFLVQKEFIEVETPMLNAIAGGASAKPFTTHHNALEADFFLRIAPELYLKRLIVGGFGRVFEIGRNFRNEGIDRDHNPEFTVMECYAAYTDYHWVMDVTEEMMRGLTQTLFNALTIHVGDKTIDLAKPFARVKYHDLIKEKTGLDIDAGSDAELLAAGRKLGTDLPDGMSRWKIIDEIFKTHVRPSIIDPVFVYDYPVDMIPLAKRCQDNPKYVECVQLVMNGTELTKAFSELNDPVDQRQRFEEQETMRAGGDEEAQQLDEAFLRSLEYGMPPTSGLGLGIDRLVAIMTNQRALKDVILFPTLKPERS